MPLVAPVGVVATTACREGKRGRAWLGGESGGLGLASAPTR